MKDFYFIYFPIGYDFIQTMIMTFRCVPKETNIIVVTNHPEILKDIKVDFNLIVLNVDNLRDEWSKENEILIYEIEAQAYRDKLFEFQDKGIKFPYGIHRCILPWLVERNITKFAILDADCLINFDNELETTMNALKEHCKDDQFVFGLTMNQISYKENFSRLVPNTLLKYNIPLSIIESIPPSYKTVDGYLRGFWFNNTEDILCQSRCGIPITTTTTTTCAIITSVIGGTGFTTTSTSTTTSTTNNCCQGGGFHALPLPGSSSSIISNGVTITASYTVPTSPLGVKQLGSGTLCPSCYPCGNYSYMIGSGVPISTSWGPTYAWDYILNFSQPIKSINLFILNFSSTEKFDIPTQTYIDADLEGIEFTTNTGKPNIELCEGCSVNVQGNKIYAESAMIGHTGVKNGSGIFRISSNTPFSTLKMTDIRIFTNSSVCYYCGPDYPSAIFWTLCGQVSK